MIAFLVGLIANWKMSEVSSRYLTDEQKLALYAASSKWLNYVAAVLVLSAFALSYARKIPDRYFFWLALTPLVVWTLYERVLSYRALRSSGAVPIYMKWFYGRTAIFSVGLLVLYAAMWNEKIG